MVRLATVRRRAAPTRVRAEERERTADCDREAAGFRARALVRRVETLREDARCVFDAEERPTVERRAVVRRAVVRRAVVRRAVPDFERLATRRRAVVERLLEPLAALRELRATVRPRADADFVAAFGRRLPAAFAAGLLRLVVARLVRLREDPVLRDGLFAFVGALAMETADATFAASFFTDLRTTRDAFVARLRALDARFFGAAAIRITSKSRHRVRRGPLLARVMQQPPWLLSTPFARRDCTRRPINGARTASQSAVHARL